MSIQDGSVYMCVCVCVFNNETGTQTDSLCRHVKRFWYSVCREGMTMQNLICMILFTGKFSFYF